MKPIKTPLSLPVPLGMKPIVYVFRVTGKNYPCYAVAMPNVTKSGYRHIFLTHPRYYHSKNGLPRKAAILRAKAESLIDGIKSYTQIAEELQKC